MQATETELASTNSTVARETWLTTCYTHTETVNLPGKAYHKSLNEASLIFLTPTTQLISSISALQFRDMSSVHPWVVQFHLPHLDDCTVEEMTSLIWRPSGSSNKPTPNVLAEWDTQATSANISRNVHAESEIVSLFSKNNAALQSRTTEFQCTPALKTLSVWTSLAGARPPNYAPA